MPEPIDSLRFVHEAILHESARLDDAIHGQLDRDAAAKLQHELAVFAELMRGHTTGEEVGLFPALVAREAHFADTYLHDHEEERALLERVGALLAAVADGDESRVGELRRASTVLRAHTSAHVEKENSYVLPWVAETFDSAGQAEILSRILGVFPPQAMQSMIPWIVTRLRDDTACAYVGALAHAVPPALFERVSAWITNDCPSARVELLRARVEGFGAATPA